MRDQCELLLPASTNSIQSLLPLSRTTWKVDKNTWEGVHYPWLLLKFILILRNDFCGVQ